MNYQKKILTDMECPKCGNNESNIWGHDLIHKDRVCLNCKFIYNRGK